MTEKPLNHLQMTEKPLIHLQLTDKIIEPLANH